MQAEPTALTPDAGLDRRTFLVGATATIAALRSAPALAAARPRAVDVVVVGANIAGIAAVRELAAAGLSVVLLAQGSHVGGMTSGGISATDIGVQKTVGGFSKRLYQDIGARLQADVVAYYFSPDVAQEVLDSYLRDAHVAPQTRRPVTSLDRHAGRWAVRAAGGRSYSARYVIDATYEGDLLRLARIPFRLGRESTAAHRESLAGVRIPNGSRVDPYVIAGDPSSGLLPGVQRSSLALGAAHGAIQAPAYRLLLTTRPDRKPWVEPATYDRSEYELLSRWMATGADPLGALVPITTSDRQLVNLNSSGLFSSDLLRFGGRAWVEARAQSRGPLAARYREYVLGLFWYLVSEPSVPQAVRAKALAHGLDPTLFVDHGGFSPELYVREGRRMVGRATLTQGRVERRSKVQEPIALGSYRLDSHPTRWVVDASGHVAAEGGMYEPTQPYPIPLGVLLPASGAPGFVTAAAVSASHVGWASLRMEPVFGMLGQAAGQLVALAARRRVTPDAVPYRALRQQLAAGGATLEV